MTLRRRSVVFAGALVAGSLLAVPSADAGNALVCSDPVPLQAATANGIDLSGCTTIDLQVVDGAVAVAVPERGGVVDIDSLTQTGTEQLTVALTDAGVLQVSNIGSERTPADVAGPTNYGSGAPECFDSAGNEAPWRESDIHSWFINPSGTPSSVGTTAARTAFVNGANNIVNARTDCGVFSPGNSPTGFRHSLAGTTTYRPNINGSGGGSCTSRDGINTVGWGRGGDFLAVTCTHYYAIGGEESESDALYNTNFSWYVSPKNCFLAYDLEAVTTHEWGHTFGLDHVSEAEHPTMTMSTNTAYCDTSPRTLGRGDAVTIYAHY